MQEIDEKKQELYFGRLYKGATKAKIGIPLGESDKLFKWINKPANILLILGPPGAGKTYILSAIVGELGNSFVGVRAFTERAFMGKIREGIDKYSNYDFIREVQSIVDCQMFIIDDLGSSAQTEWRDEIFMEALDYCIKNQTPTIITSNLTKEEINERFHPRVCSRLFSTKNTIVDLSDMPDLRQEGK